MHEEHYRILVESVFDWLWEVDKNAVYTYCSPQIKDILGYEVEEVIGKTPFDLMPEDEAHRMRDIFSVIVASRQGVKKLINKNLHRDGRVVVLETSASPIIDEQGNFLGYRGIDRDVTERVHAERALAESERRFRSIFNSMHDVYFQTTMDGNIVTVSPSVEKMLGYDPGYLRGKKTQDIYIVPEQREQFLTRLSESGSVNDYEISLRHKNGHTIEASVTARLRKGKRGEQGCIEGILRDITERKRAEEERKILSLVVEQSNVAVMITDANGVLEYVNQAFEELTGYRSGEVVGHRASVMKSGEQDEEFYKDLWDTITSGESFSGTVKNRRKDGSLYLEEKIITPIKSDHGEITHYVSTGRDVTEIQRVEMQLQQSDKLASIGQLAAGVAHEINNPIGYVNSNLSTLKTYIDDLLGLIDAYEMAVPEGSEAHESVEAVRRRIEVDYLKEDLVSLVEESREGLNRVKGIVQSLKDFSRADYGEEWHCADLHKGLESTLNIVNNEIKYKAQLIKEYGDIPEIECIPSQINQVFMNLLVNAAHAITEQGTITVRTGMATDGNHVWVQVEDSGKGIDEDKLGKIFEPFYTTKPVGQGTGLGLSLSYGIIQSHHGQIDVESTPGEGTCFTVTLPVTQSQVAGESGADAIRQ